MKIPTEVVKSICDTYQHNDEILASLEYASNTYIEIENLRRQIDQLVKEYEQKKNVINSKIKAVEDKCRHFFKEYRSGVDSVDDFEQCLVCGEYR